MKKILLISFLLLLLPLEVSAKTFTDIDSSNPYYLATSYLSEKGIVNGYNDGSFKPFNEINRAELLKIIMEANNTEIINPTENCFPDVPHSQWYAPYICTAKENGFIKGYDDNTFKPENSINKVEALKMLGEIFQWDLDSTSETTLFSDTDSSEWYAPYLKYAKNKNYLPVAGNLYSPSSNITRGSISETLFRFLASNEYGHDEFNSTTFEMAKTELNITTTKQQESTDTLVTSTVSGIISDAMNGKALANANILLYNLNDELLNQTTSNEEGAFELVGPNYPGNYLLISKDGFYSLTLYLTNVKKKEIHASLSRTFSTIDPEELRIVLTWGDSSNDFDAHLVDPQDEEISFMHRISSSLNTILDTDSTTPYGTETITLSALQSGTYEFFVHNYSGEDSFNEANVRVEIYNSSGLAKIYKPAEPLLPIWKVFMLDSTGKITDVNELGDCEILDKPSFVCE